MGPASNRRIPYMGGGPTCRKVSNRVNKVPLGLSSLRKRIARKNGGETGIYANALPEPLNTKGGGVIKQDRRRKKKKDRVTAVRQTKKESHRNWKADGLPRKISKSRQVEKKNLVRLRASPMRKCNT